MKKKILLSLGAALLTIGASAATYNPGEAFMYTISPEAFSFALAGDTEGYSQYPAAALQGQASMEYGFGLASAWFNGRQFATPADADTDCPVVEDPFGEGYVVRMQTNRWDGFGNFNFALPEVNEPCRIRVIYRVDHTAADNTWYQRGAQKTFKVKLMSDADQDTYDYPQLEEDNVDFWENPGWRVADFVGTPDADTYYLSLLWDAAGLSCQRNVPFYVKEVSVVPVSKLEGYEAPAAEEQFGFKAGITVTEETPDFVSIKENGQGGDGNLNFKLGEAFSYAIAPEAFSFDLAGDTEGYSQYPAAALQGQASMEYGFGLASAWFNGRQFATPAEANTDCPVVEDPFGEGYVVRMQTTRWDGFGNFNFALPEVNEPCRIRVIYRVDHTAADNAWYQRGAQKTFKVKLMSDADQDTYDYPQLEEDNVDFWENPGWRVADFVGTPDADTYYLSLLWDAAGLSCQRNVPFYVKEVSVVPVSKLEGYEAPAVEEQFGFKSGLTITDTLPALVIVGNSGAVDAVVTDTDNVKVYGLNGRIAVEGFSGLVEVYNIMGQSVAKAVVNEGSQIEVPSGLAIVKAGNKVAKVVVR